MLKYSVLTPIGFELVSVRVLKRTCVLQILGLLRQYNKFVFRLRDGSSVEAYLSGDALCSLLGGDCKLYLFAPASLITVTKAGKDPEEVFRRGWFYKIESIIQDIINSSGYVYNSDVAGVRVLPSTGSYFFGDDRKRTLVFRGVDHRDIELATFIYMLELLGYGSESRECDELIFDFSTGLNLYVTVASGILKSVIIAYKLANIDKVMEGQELPSPVKVSYVPPIVKDIKGPYDIELENIDTRLFFDYPLPAQRINNLKPNSFVRNENITDQTKKAMGESYGKLFKKIKRILKLGLFLHNAIKYNTPLVIYYMKEINRIGEDLTSERVLELLQLVKDLVFREAWDSPKITRTGNETIISFIGSNRTTTLYTMQALLETSSLLKIHDKLVQGVDLSHGVGIRKIKNDFVEGIYSKNPDLAYEFALNKRMLERDLNEINEKTIESKQIEKSSCIRLDKIMEASERCHSSKEEEKSRQDKKSSDIKRNFFAHSGFLRNIVEICRRDEDILVRYVLNDKTSKTLADWLSDPT